MPLTFGMDHDENQYVWHLEHRTTRLLLPEHGLILALIEDAVDVMNHPGKKKAALLLETAEWFRSDDHVYVFSFINCCEALGWDPGYVRRKIEWPIAMTPSETGS